MNTNLVGVDVSLGRFVCCGGVRVRPRRLGLTSSVSVLELPLSPTPVSSGMVGASFSPPDHLMFHYGTDRPPRWHGYFRRLCA